MIEILGTSQVHGRVTAISARIDDDTRTNDLPFLDWCRMKGFGSTLLIVLRSQTFENGSALLILSAAYRP
jgi:hypothetical protein